MNEPRHSSPPPLHTHDFKMGNVLTEHRKNTDYSVIQRLAPVMDAQHSWSPEEQCGWGTTRLRGWLWVQAERVEPLVLTGWSVSWLRRRYRQRGDLKDKNRTGAAMDAAPTAGPRNGVCARGQALGWTFYILCHLTHCSNNVAALFHTVFWYLGLGRPVISGLGRSRQENSYNFKVSLGYLEVTSEAQATGLGM